MVGAFLIRMREVSDVENCIFLAFPKNVGCEANISVLFLPTKYIFLQSFQNNFLYPLGFEQPYPTKPMVAVSTSTCVVYFGGLYSNVWL